MNKESSNLSGLGLWNKPLNKENLDFKEKIGCSSYPGVPKTRCPPAKPPRRKLSFPCDKSHLDSSKSNLKTGSTDAALSGPTSLPACINQSNKPNSSKDSSPAPLDGSDYGSLQGDIWPPKMTNIDPNWQRYVKPATNIFCSTPTNIGLFQHPSYYNPVANSSASTYFTPPHSMPWNSSSNNLMFELNTKKLNIPFMVGKVTPCHRRHHSDPQITLERKPSLPRKPFPPGNPGFSSRRSHSFASSHGQVRLQATSSAGYVQHRHFHSDPLVLVEEVRMLREICNKLWGELQQTQSKLEVLQNHSQGMTSKPNFSELLSEVYYAQRERDQAVQQRLELAFKERDQAMKEVEHMKQLLARWNIRDSAWSDEEEVDGSDINNQSLEQMVASLESCWSPARLHQQREQLLYGVHRANEAKQKDIIKEIQDLLQQRDNALAKANLLSEEFEHCRCKPNSSWECNGFAKEERSKALQRMEDLEDELESLRLCYSLHSSLEGTSNGVGPCLQLPSSPEHLQLKLQEETKARLEAQKECTRLERWVSVLIKKLNGLSVGVAV